MITYTLAKKVSIGSRTTSMALNCYLYTPTRGYDRVYVWYYQRKVRQRENYGSSEMSKVTTCSYNVKETMSGSLWRCDDVHDLRNYTRHTHVMLLKHSKYIYMYLVLPIHDGHKRTKNTRKMTCYSNLIRWEPRKRKFKKPKWPFLGRVFENLWHYYEANSMLTLVYHKNSCYLTRNSNSVH